MRTYKVLARPPGWPSKLPYSVQPREGGEFGVGDEFETEFTEDEETANLASGLLELQPMKYRVIGGSEVHGTQPGDEFELALPMGQEALLIEGGHIERVEAPKPAPKTTRRKKEAK